MISGYLTVTFIFIGWMLFVAPTLDYADPLFALLIYTPDFFLHQVEVADQDPARGSPYAEQCLRK